MLLSLKQKRFIKSKFSGYKLLKGNSGTGKTTAAINKVSKLLKTSSVEKDDNVLILSLNDDHLAHMKNMYHNISSGKYVQKSFFDDINRQKLDILKIDEMIEQYFNDNLKHHGKRKLINEDEKIGIINEAVRKLILKHNEYARNKVIKTSDIHDLSAEISWIKKCNFKNIETYKESIKDKTEEGLYLRKNSIGREIVYHIYQEYEKILRKNDLMDNEDSLLYAINEGLSKDSKKYTHILVDSIQEYNKGQLDFISSIYNNKEYSTMMFVLDSDKLAQSSGWISKKRSFKTLGLNMRGKSINFKDCVTAQVIDDAKVNLAKNTADSEKLNLAKNIADNGKAGLQKNTTGHAKLNIMQNTVDNAIQLSRKEEKKMSTDNIKNNTTENITDNNPRYIDFGRNMCREFFVDSISKKDVYTAEDNFEQKVNDLVEIPVFNEIAAGNPILMNENMSSEMFLPKDWIRASRDVFMLKIKGDSMIKRNINDGDYVVINKGKYPRNHDIVAVEIEGGATLKTLNTKGKRVTLIPENDAYEPIVLDPDKECSILGVAIGIIKNL